MSSFFDHHNIDPVKVISIVNDISLKIIHGDGEKIKFGMSTLRVAIFKLLYLEKISKEEATNKNDTSTTRLLEKAISVEDKIESFLKIK